MVRTSIIILEESPYWEAELSRRLADCDVRLMGCRTISEARSTLQENPGSLFITGRHLLSGEMLLFLSEILESANSCGVVLIRGENEWEIEWIAREMGVIVVVIDEYRSAQELERYCRNLKEKPGLGESRSIASKASSGVR